VIRAKTVIGVIADTHGLIRPAALAALRGSDLIIHAGDVGKPEVIAALTRIAPTIAVRGNVDTGGWADDLPLTARIEAGGCPIFVLHQIAQLDFDPGAAGLAAVVFGHSHVAAIETRDGVLYLNPGSAGPRRFKLGISVARVVAAEGRLRPQIVRLEG
jgi:putative phosphoesterase